MQKPRAHEDEEHHLGRDSIAGSLCEPVVGVDADLEMDEARSQWGRHAVDDAAVALAVAAGDERGALGQLVLTNLAVEDELVQDRLHHRNRGRQLLKVDESAAGVDGGRQEGPRRPAGAPVRVAPGDTAQFDGVEQQGPDVDILAVCFGGDLLGDLAFGAGGTPHKIQGWRASTRSAKVAAISLGRSV